MRFRHRPEEYLPYSAASSQSADISDEQSNYSGEITRDWKAASGIPRTNKNRRVRNSIWRFVPNVPSWPSLPTFDRNHSVQ